MEIGLRLAAANRWSRLTPSSFFMKSKLHWILNVGLFLGLVAQAQEESYPVHPDTRKKEGVPEGKVDGPFQWKSEIYPGTIREVWYYVPAQYTPEKSACTMVVQDGLNRARGWKLMESMDNLIADGSMPVCIGIFISPGIVPAPHDQAQPRFNRSFEYDALGDRYARFLMEEIIPAAEARFNLSRDPNDRLIAGASSGAICAFNVAWERPDAFRRVLSTIGTYVGLRGGHEFPTLVRKVEPKPIRVFLQDGTNDLNLYAGGWWTANLGMLDALEWAGYDVKHAWGQGGHNSKHSAAIMPDMLRWLWRDYPSPISKPNIINRRMDILQAGESWELVSEGHSFTEGPAVAQDGGIYFSDLRMSEIFKVDPKGKVSRFATDTARANGLMVGTDGRLYACANELKEIHAYGPDGRREVVAEGVRSNDIVFVSEGFYFTDPDNHRVYYHANQGGEPRVVDTGIERPNGIAISPDRTLLYVSDTRGVFVYSFQIQADGALTHKQPYFHLHVPYGKNGTDADGMTVDREGRLYVTTNMGIQICDQPGRVHLIVDKPQAAWLSNVVFAGKDGRTLYATCGDKVYRRHVRAEGLLPWGDPVKPPRPRL